MKETFYLKTQARNQSGGGGGEVFSALFQKLEKSALICEKKGPD